MFCRMKTAPSSTLNWFSRTLLFFLCTAGPSACGQALVDEGIWTAYFSQGELNGPESKAKTASGGLMPIGDTLVMNFSLLKESFVRVLERD